MRHFKTKIIELFGLPATGKTTTLNALIEYLENNSISFTIVQERASVCPIKDKLHPSFNYWTAVSLIKAYLEANDKGYDYLIADRGILDAYVWVHLLSQRIQNVNYIKCFESLINQDFILENYLLSFNYKAEYDIILKREADRRLIKGKNEQHYSRIMNYEILNLYNLTYEEIKPKLKNISNIVELDSTHENVAQILLKVSENIDRYIKS